MKEVISTQDGKANIVIVTPSEAASKFLEITRKTEREFCIRSADTYARHAGLPLYSDLLAAHDAPKRRDLIHEAMLEDCAAKKALSGTHELHLNENIDHGIEDADKPLCRFFMYRDSGDSGAGLPSRQYWALAEDQTGTILADLITQAAELNRRVQKLVAEKEGAESVCKRANADVEMYARAWKRELLAFDGRLMNKRNLIDALVLSTRDLVERLKAIEAITKKEGKTDDQA